MGYSTGRADLNDTCLVCEEKLPKRVLEDPDTGEEADADWLSVGVACDAVAAMVDIAVGPDGTVSGLEDPMEIAVELAAKPMSDRVAWASFVADLDCQKLVVHSWTSLSRREFAV
jgi:hypothetical protein